MGTRRSRSWRAAISGVIRNSALTVVPIAENQRPGAEALLRYGHEMVPQFDAARMAALAAQRLFRHKSSKASFQTTYWITVVLNCAALGWLLSPHGAQTLQAVLATI